MYNDYYFYNLVIDIRATELHNESEEVKRDDKVDMGTCEVSESRSKILGKTGYVICISLHICLIPYCIVRIFQGPKPSQISRTDDNSRNYYCHNSWVWPEARIMQVDLCLLIAKF